MAVVEDAVVGRARALARAVLRVAAALEEAAHRRAAVRARAARRLAADERAIHDVEFVGIRRRGATIAEVDAAAARRIARTRQERRGAVHERDALDGRSGAVDRHPQAAHAVVAHAARLAVAGSALVVVRSVIGFVICARDSVDETVTVPFE